MGKTDGLISEYPLGERIRFLRKDRGMTQDVLAKKCGISQGFLAQVEKSQTLPSLTVLYTLSKYLDVHVSILFASDEVFVFDIRKLRTKYHTKKSWTPAMRRAFVEVEKYLAALTLRREP